MCMGSPHARSDLRTTGRPDRLDKNETNLSCQMSSALPCLEEQNLRNPVRDGLRAGTVAAIVSGFPSTFSALAMRHDPLEASLAAGSLLLPREERRDRFIAAAIPVHLAISGFWGVVLAATLPHRRTMSAGAVAGVAIGVFDLMVIGKRFPRIRVLPVIPQLADHIAFGLTVAWMLQGSEKPLWQRRVEG
jgi:hypothetical protein